MGDGIVTNLLERNLNGKFFVGYIKEISSIEGVEGKRNKFKELAKEFSDCSSAKRGGDLGVSQYTKDFF